MEAKHVLDAVAKKTLCHTNVCTYTKRDTCPPVEGAQYSSNDEMINAHVMNGPPQEAKLEWWCM